MTPIYILATYMLTFMIIQTNGPGGIFYNLRKETQWEVLTCFPCCSMWVALLLALVPADNFINWMVLALAFAGGATIVDTLIERILYGNES